MDSAELPSEEEQFNAYRKVASALKGAPVIIRTLDVGGDKEIPYLHMVKEENPFMGFRAVRYCLANPDQYKVQLRALLRASAFGDVKIMIPLVTCVEEVLAVKELVEQCKTELTEEGRKFNENIPPLINAYMNLSPTMRVFDTVSNPDFGGVEETGILVTIRDIYPEKRLRYTRWLGWRANLKHRREEFSERLREHFERIKKKRNA